jgi:pyroglutamyl-peptidase
VILVTGFTPFDVYQVNPSELVVHQLNNTIIHNYSVKGYILPVNYSKAPEKMKQLITTFSPHLIISLGLAGTENKIRIEQIAINLRIDPEQTFPLLTLKKVNKSGPFFQIATYDASAIQSKITMENIPVKQSYSAGLYLCNAILYETIYYLKEKEISTPMGFIHLPPLVSQHPDGMKLETMIEAVSLAISSQILE